MQGPGGREKTLINMVRGNSWADETHVEGEESGHQFHPPCVRHHSGPSQESAGRRCSKGLDPEPSRPTFMSARTWARGRVMWPRGALEVFREPPPQDSIRMKEIRIRWCFHYRAWCLSFLIASLRLILIFMMWVESKFYSWRNCNIDSVSRVTGAGSGGLGIQTWAPMISSH